MSIIIKNVFSVKIKRLTQIFFKFFKILLNILQNFLEILLEILDYNIIS